jgi:hypothetical protein
VTQGVESCAVMYSRTLFPMLTGVFRGALPPSEDLDMASLGFLTKLLAEKSNRPMDFR